MAATSTDIPGGETTRRQVYDQCMARSRTNIELDDRDVEAVMARYNLTTKTAAVALALAHLAGQPMTRDEALAMEGAHAIGDLPTEDQPPATL